MDSLLPIKTIRKSSFYLTVLSMAKHIPNDDEYRESLALLPLVGLCAGAVSVALGYLAYITVGWPLHCIFAIATSTLLTAGLYYKDCAACFDYFESETAPIVTSLLLVFSILIKIGVLLALGVDWWIAAFFAPMVGRLAYVYSRFSGMESEQPQLVSVRTIVGIGAPLLLGLAVVKVKFLAILTIIALSMFAIKKLPQFNNFHKDHITQASGVFCESAEIISMLLLCAFSGNL
jgi:hypothetical protein